MRCNGETGCNLRVCILADLTLTVGNCHRTFDDRNRPIARIEPPVVPMFLEIVRYLEEKPVPRVGSFRLADEARAATAVCIRLGSYFAILADASRPFSPTARDEQSSQIDDSEMARMNSEISAGIEWWLSLKGSDETRYRRLVERALAYLPLGPKTVRRSSEGDVLWGCAWKELATKINRAWAPELLNKDLELAAKHPIRVISNSVTLQSWRNGPIEDLHAGRCVGHAVNERRVLPRDEKAIIRQAQSGLVGALRGVESLVLDQAWPPPPDRVLPFMAPFIHPSGWTYTEQSRVIDLPLRC